MNRKIAKKLFRIGAITALVIVVIYGYSYAFKNKTVHNNSPLSPDKTSSSPSKQSNTPLPAATPVQTVNRIVAEGTFRSAPGESAKGTAQLITVEGKYVIRFEDDFKLGASPDPIVYFGNDDKTDFATKIGPLQGTKGSQNYDVPSGIDVSKYQQIIVYCQSFHVPLGYADLKLK